MRRAITRSTAWLESRTRSRRGRRSRIPGRPLLHRLNRAEYANAIRDLLALDVDVAVAAAAGRLGVRLRQHLRRAGRVAVAAGALPVGGREDQRAGGRRSVDAAPVTETYRVRQDLSQNQHIEGLPLGTVGGMLVRHTFPLDAEYDLQVRFFRTNFGNLRGLEYPHQVEITLDGAAGPSRDDRRRRRSARRVRETDGHGRRDRRAARGPRAGEGGTAHGRRRASSRTCRSPTRRGCSRSCAARPTRSTGPAGRISTA